MNIGIVDLSWASWISRGNHCDQTLPLQFINVLVFLPTQRNLMQVLSNKSKDISWVLVTKVSYCNQVPNRASLCGLMITLYEIRNKIWLWFEFRVKGFYSTNGNVWPLTGRLNLYPAIRWCVRDIWCLCIIYIYIKMKLLQTPNKGKYVQLTGTVTGPFSKFE